MTSLDFVALVAIFLFGVPHGGFDAAIARRSGWPMDGRLSWIIFHVTYVALALAVALLWWWFPLFSLGLFLLVSGYHFGGSDIADIGSDWLPWITHGGLVPIAIPSINPEAVKPIFSILIGAYEADILLSIIQIIFFLWLLALIAYCLFALYKKQYGKPLTGLVAIIAIAVLLPPLVCFAVYFCFWHSRGHIARLWHSLHKNKRLAAVQEAIAYTLLAWIGAVIFFFYLSGSLSDILLQLTFIGLAALTWPHMILVDYMDRRRKL
jgi:Brp/Blh family beta-carotene 15,15'-monooxygenase